MAVYEKTYRPYTGPLTPEKTRFLVLPRYAFQDIFESKLFVAFLVLCFVWPLILATAIYLPHNASFLKLLQNQSGEPLFTIDGRFFLYGFLLPQSWMAFFVAFLIGPAVISADFRNNGLPLYLSRPFSRADYILGKASILVLLLSAVTWVPGLLLFFLQSYLAGWGWLKENANVGLGVFLGSCIWVAILCLISLSLSAYVKWKPVARAAMFGVFIVASGMSGVINATLGTRWGSLLNISDMAYVIWADMCGVATSIDVPPWCAWIALISACAFALLILVRKVRAYEVVR